jgi:N-methylhydantoinase A
MGGLRVAVDIGGTFTDCVVVDEAGRRTVTKSLTTPGRLADGVLDATRLAADALGRTMRELLEDTGQFVHGTTQATNALLTRTGAVTGLLTTQGHEDALLIGRVSSQRAGLSEGELSRPWRLAKPVPIVPRALIRGVAERIDRDGEVVVALDEAAAVLAIAELVAAGVQSIAVSLLWSFANDDHERRLAALLAAHAPGIFVALSSELAPVLGEYERTATTAVNAYVGPKVSEYLQMLDSRLREAGLAQPLLVMQASGGLTSIADAARRPIVTLDSGPTGGILGCRYLSEVYEEPNVICTDVGGTSFEVGLVLDGEVPLDERPIVGQYALRTPKVAVRSIGAGGGSIAWIDDGGLLRVGPQSAAADPGPACYGLGGIAPTLTDADLVLGYLNPARFLGGRMALDRDAALAALGRLGAGLGMEPEEVAIGIFTVMNAQMADLIRKSTIEQGHDPRDCILLAYGGAGPTHAAFYGQDIGVRAIVTLADSTAFSAEGMLTCDMTHSLERSRIHAAPYTAGDVDAIAERFTALEDEVRTWFVGEGLDPAEVRLIRRLGVRYSLQVTTLDVDVDPGELDRASLERTLDRFAGRYEQLYGSGALIADAGTAVELHSVVGVSPIQPVPMSRHDAVSAEAAETVTGSRSVHFPGTGFTDTEVLAGTALVPGAQLHGPLVVERMGDSLVLPPGFSAEVDDYLSIWVRPEAATAGALAQTATSGVPA